MELYRTLPPFGILNNRFLENRPASPSLSAFTSVTCRHDLSVVSFRLQEDEDHKRECTFMSNHQENTHYLSGTVLHAVLL